MLLSVKCVCYVTDKMKTKYYGSGDPYREQIRYLSTRHIIFQRRFDQVMQQLENLEYDTHGTQEDYYRMMELEWELDRLGKEIDNIERELMMLQNQ